MRTNRAGLSIVMFASLAPIGCSVATSVDRDTEAIKTSTATIDANTKAIAESARGTDALVPALQGVERLRGPMESVAALDPTLRGVAGLNEPMVRVASLDAPISRLANLGALLDHPMLLVLLVALGFAAWGGVTFIAVRLAQISAARATAGTTAAAR